MRLHCGMWCLSNPAPVGRIRSIETAATRVHRILTPFFVKAIKALQNSSKIIITLYYENLPRVSFLPEYISIHGGRWGNSMTEKNPKSKNDTTKVLCETTVWGWISPSWNCRSRVLPISQYWKRAWLCKMSPSHGGRHRLLTGPGLHLWLLEKWWPLPLTESFLHFSGVLAEDEIALLPFGSATWHLHVKLNTKASHTHLCTPSFA